MPASLPSNLARSAPAITTTPPHAPPPHAPARRPLTDAEFACVQAYCTRTLNNILHLDVTLHVEHDFREFARLRRSLGDGFCYPSLDPAQCRIEPDAFWLHVLDDAGRTMATLAARIFSDVEDFYQLMRSETLWNDRHLHEVGRCRPSCTIPSFGGVIGHSGGMWVCPSQRGRGLAGLMQSLSRGLQLRNHAIDFDTGLVFEPLVQFALNQYRYPRCEPVIDGYFPPTAKTARVYLCHMTRDEALRSMGFSMSFAADDHTEPLEAVA
jgi:hypothetical protein